MLALMAPNSQVTVNIRSAQQNRIFLLPVLVNGARDDYSDELQFIESHLEEAVRHALPPLYSSRPTMFR